MEQKLIPSEIVGPIWVSFLGFDFPFLSLDWKACEPREISARKLEVDSSKNGKVLRKLLNKEVKSKVIGDQLLADWLERVRIESVTVKFPFSRTTNKAKLEVKMTIILKDLPNLPGRKAGRLSGIKTVEKVWSFPELNFRFEEPQEKPRQVIRPLPKSKPAPSGEEDGKSEVSTSSINPALIFSKVAPPSPDPSGLESPFAVDPPMEDEFTEDGHPAELEEEATASPGDFESPFAEDPPMEDEFAEEGAPNELEGEATRNPGDFESPFAEDPPVEDEFAEDGAPTELEGEATRNPGDFESPFAEDSPVEDEFAEEGYSAESGGATANPGDFESPFSEDPPMGDEFSEDGFSADMEETAINEPAVLEETPTIGSNEQEDYQEGKENDTRELAESKTNPEEVSGKAMAYEVFPEFQSFHKKTTPGIPNPASNVGNDSEVKVQNPVETGHSGTESSQDDKAKSPEEITTEKFETVSSEETFNQEKNTSAPNSFPPSTIKSEPSKEFPAQVPPSQEHGQPAESEINHEETEKPLETKKEEISESEPDNNKQIENPFSESVKSIFGAAFDLDDDDDEEDQDYESHGYDSHSEFDFDMF